MSYKDKDILKQFISESIIKEKLDTDAGKDFRPEDSQAYTAGAQGAGSFSDRWGWGLNAGKAKKAKGILGFFGLPQSVPDFVGSVGEFFAAVWKLASDAGRFFIDVLTKTINPSPASPRVADWTKSMFPGINAWVSSNNKASWGSSYGKASVPSLGPKPTVDFEFKAGSRVRESIITEQADTSFEFLAALTQDVERLISITRAIQDASDIVSMVSDWQKIVDTESASSVLIPQVAALKPSDIDMQSIMEIFLKDIVEPFIENGLKELMTGINNSPAVPNDTKVSSESIIMSAIQSI
tara:strand:+ start:241 stop:1128 length:888 start_codon:yes stop_codon:yes gene_type:complete